MKTEQGAFKDGYQAFQVRRGNNPYPTMYGFWEAWENGWAKAYADNAPDLSHEELERRAGSTGHTAYREALNARQPPPRAGRIGGEG